MLPAVISSCDFSLSHYRSIIIRAIQMGYRFFTHYEHAVLGQAKEPFILLRHDIDVSLEQAIPIFKIEKELGVRSSVFIRVHASGYNPFDIFSYAVIDELKRSGFEIALHYEPLFMLLTQEDPLTMLARAKRVLENIVDSPIHGLASHAPRLSPLLKNFDAATMKSLGFLYNASDSLFTNQNLYLSDSNRRWRNGCVCGYIGLQDRITLLTHPGWWSPVSNDCRYTIINNIRLGK